VARRKRRTILDDGKRNAVVAIISVGCGVDVAAKYVGCSASTIRRTAAREPDFNEQLRQARSNAELSLVKNIRKAGNKEQYWRAAAWALERGFPDKYAPRQPDAVTREQLRLMLAEFVEIIIADLPERYRKRVVKKVNSISRLLDVELKLEIGDDP